MKKEKLQAIILLVIIMFGLCYSYIKFLFLPQWEVIKSDSLRLKSLQNKYQELLLHKTDSTGLQKTLKP